MVHGLCMGKVVYRVSAVVVIVLQLKYDGFKFQVFSFHVEFSYLNIIYNLTISSGYD